MEKIIFKNTHTGYTGVIQEWTVPSNGVYRITARGASSVTAPSSSRLGGYGAIVQGDFELNSGDSLKILVGQMGTANSYEAGGGGGTFVVINGNTPLVVAGGGGGPSNNENGISASLTERGASGGNGGAQGGSAGTGGLHSSNQGSGGGGLLSDGTGGGWSAGCPWPGKAFVNGGDGGANGSNGGVPSGAYGGFGGGGSTHGNWLAGPGGGGYSGGGAGASGRGGGGGGSYNSGLNKAASIHSQYDHGLVTIELVADNPGVFLTKKNGKWITVRMDKNKRKNARKDLLAQCYRKDTSVSTLITQTNEIVGARLSGIGTYNTVGQAVFSIGWDYVFASMNSNQLYGTLIKVDPETGAPLQVLRVNSNIYADIPTGLSWNAGRCMHSTTVDGVQYLYLRYDDWNATSVYRGVWDDTLKQFKSFTIFSTMSQNIAGGTYNNMARIDENTIRIITDARNMFEFDIRTGAEKRLKMNIGGSWSPSSYPFANSFVPIKDKTMLIGASGSGNNWYVQSDEITPTSFDPASKNSYIYGLAKVGSTWCTHPSTHHNVSYYTPNDGTITAYRSEGVYIQERRKI